MSTYCADLIDQIANSGLDQDKVAQDFRDIKRPTVSPQNDGCTVPIIRLIHYEVSSPLPDLLFAQNIFVLLFLAMVILPFCDFKHCY